MPNRIFEQSKVMLDSLSTNFTWRKVFFIFVTLFFSVGAVIIFENYTGYFKLTKIDKSLNILNEIAEFSKKYPQYAKEDLTTITVNITNDFSNFVNQSKTPFDLPVWLLKAYAAFFPWMLACLIVMQGNTPISENSITNLMLFSLPYTFIGAILPTFQYPLINYLLYPVGAFFLNTVFLVIRGKMKINDNFDRI